jgi:hypothetical protein
MSSFEIKIKITRRLSSTVSGGRELRLLMP